jgi:hypothetical protein
MKTETFRARLLAGVATPRAEMRDWALLLAADLAVSDPNIAGVTVIQPSGETAFLDAVTLRQGGRA